jgi:hypothetical protein
MERDEEHFDLDQEFTAGAEDVDYDRFIERVDRRKPVIKRGKAAWSKLEDVLAENARRRTEGRTTTVTFEDFSPAARGPLDDHTPTPSGPEVRRHSGSSVSN